MVLSYESGGPRGDRTSATGAAGRATSSTGTAAAGVGTENSVMIGVCASNNANIDTAAMAVKAKTAMQTMATTLTRRFIVVMLQRFSFPGPRFCGTLNPNWNCWF